MEIPGEMTADRSEASVLLSHFEHISIINLPDRADRRKEMESELRQLGSTPKAGLVEFFPALRATAKDDWPSFGARGCFLSHYTVLKQARERGLRNILVLEDDCEFAQLLVEIQRNIVKTLSETPWDFVHLGHSERPAATETPALVRWYGPVMCTHLYAVNHAVLDRLVTFLEQVMQRPEGHPEGGPQHYDGALAMFRAQNEDLVTLLAAPNLARQRSSRSDIHGRWFDQVPGLRAAVNGLRKVSRRVR